MFPLQSMSIDEHMNTWVECEEQKSAPKLVLKEINAKQRIATKAIKLHLATNNLRHLDLPMGYRHTVEDVEKLSLNEDVCTPYLTPDVLHRMITEQTTCKPCFKVIRPSKKEKRKRDEYEGQGPVDEQV
jgi:hypothetical protein